MTAVLMTEEGGPEVLVLGTAPVPELQQGEVLIKVAAAGVNRPDCIQRQGLYPAPKGHSAILVRPFFHAPTIISHPSLYRGSKLRVKS
jgi:NADPH2:quinone reductase